MHCNNLDEVRANIDRIDSAIIALIAERGEYVAQAAAFKKNEEGVKDSSRVEKVIQKVRSKAETLGADPDMVEKLYRQMIASFIKKEMAEFNGNKPITLLDNIHRIFTTPMGAQRIAKIFRFLPTPTLWNIANKKFNRPNAPSLATVKTITAPSTALPSQLTLRVSLL